MEPESRVRWERYNEAEEEVFARTNIDETLWFIVTRRCRARS